jgi:hypothetical protein
MGQWWQASDSFFRHCRQRVGSSRPKQMGQPCWVVALQAPGQQAARGCFQINAGHRIRGEWRCGWQVLCRPPVRRVAGRSETGRPGTCFACFSSSPSRLDTQEARRARAIPASAMPACDAAGQQHHCVFCENSSGAGQMLALAPPCSHPFRMLQQPPLTGPARRAARWWLHPLPSRCCRPGSRARRLWPGRRCRRWR